MHLKLRWLLNKTQEDELYEKNYCTFIGSVYDLRLVFEDGSYQDFEAIDFSAAKSMIYLDKAE